MEINILYFGLIAEALARSSEQLQVPENTSIGQLKSLLMKQYPALEKLEFQWAVNEELTTEEATLTPQDTVALLPPFAGG